MKTTRGREIEALEVVIDENGWSWAVKDGEDWEMLSPENIAEINESLAKDGVIINKLNRDYPEAQVLCG